MIRHAFHIGLLVASSAAVFTTHAVEVSGIVTDSAAGSPLANVVVSLRATGGFGGGGQTLARDTTDASGAYTLSHDTTGTFIVRASLNGYVTKNVDVTLAADPVSLDIQLVRIEYARVSGTVSDSASGNPITGAAVSLRTTTGFGTTRRDTTDANGAYSFDSVASGLYILFVDAPLYAIKVESLTVAGTDQQVDFQLVEAVFSSVGGTINDSLSGSPIVGAVVSLRFGNSTLMSDTTDTDGAYSFDSVKNGTYSIRASAPGYVSKSVAVTTSGVDPQKVDIALALIQYSTISGVISDSTTGNPLNGAIVTLREGNRTIARDTTNADGAYSFDRVETGTYTLRVTLIGYVTKSIDVQVSGTDAQTFNVELTPAQSGTIVYQDGFDLTQPIVVAGTRIIFPATFSKVTRVQLFDINGKILLSRHITVGTASIAVPMRHTSGSVYVVAIAQGTATYRSRIVIK